MQTLNLLAVVGVVITSLAVLVLENYRYSLAAMVLQYLFAFFLISSIWPVGLAVIKLIVGWIVCSLIGSAYLQNHIQQSDEVNMEKMVFSSLSAVVVWLIVFTISDKAALVLGLSRPMLLGAGILIGMGVLQLGSTTNLLRVLFGLLTVLSGFEVIYAGLEESVLVTGLLASVNILFGFMGWYMIHHNSNLENA
jgi:hypothetical protein